MASRTLYRLPSDLQIAMWIFLCHDKHGAAWHWYKCLVSGAVKSKIDMSCLLARLTCTSSTLRGAPFAWFPLVEFSSLRILVSLPLCYQDTSILVSYIWVNFAVVGMVSLPKNSEVRITTVHPPRSPWHQHQKLFVFRLCWADRATRQPESPVPAHGDDDSRLCPCGRSHALLRRYTLSSS